jgi:hypothetical protein
MKRKQLHLLRACTAAMASKNHELAIACTVLLGKTIGMWPDEPSGPELEILRRYGVSLGPLTELTS